MRISRGRGVDPRENALEWLLRLKLSTFYDPMLNPISFIVWNLRGASRPDSIKYLHKLCVDNKLSLVFLLEPMSEVKQLDMVRRRLKLDHGASFLNGKVWCLWSRVFKLSFLEGEEQVVHARLTFQSGEIVNILAVYAKCTRVGRRPFGAAWKVLMWGRVSRGL